MDKTVFSVGTFKDSTEERRAYWHSLSPEQRLEGLEFLRSQMYADPKVPPRLQRTLKIIYRS